ncbi:MAG: hypothetical protein U0790_14515 [Isosphaeraceae bacterium]
MRTLIWAAAAMAGFGLMVGAYDRWLRPDPEAPWAAGVLVIGDDEPAEKSEAGTILATRLRYLPLSPAVEALVKGVAGSVADRGAALRARLRRKLIELPANEMGLLVGWLREGRMPEPGEGEALAGCESALGEDLSVAGRSLKVVGVLKPSVALFADSILVPAGPAAEPIFAGKDPALSRVRIVRLTEREYRDRSLRERLEKAFPPKSFSTLAPLARSDATGYRAYLAGQALFLLGGTGLLVSLYRWLARRVRWPALAGPLAEIAARPRLFWGTHVAYFGLYLLAAIAIHSNPALHTVMMTSVQQAFSGGGPLAVAGAAYLSGNILWAAVVTFAVNFFLGTLLQITLPSLIIPGVGVLVAVVRAGLWGLLLGPADSTLALGMIPHSGTLLLEGEGYILATFFALLIPILLIRPGTPEAKPSLADEWTQDELPEAPAPETETVGRRYRRAASLALKALALVALVLAVAALYEATEVILMAGL